MCTHQSHPALAYQASLIISSNATSLMLSLYSVLPIAAGDILSTVADQPLGQWIQLWLVGKHFLVPAKFILVSVELHGCPRQNTIGFFSTCQSSVKGNLMRFSLLLVQVNFRYVFLCSTVNQSTLSLSPADGRDWESWSELAIQFPISVLCLTSVYAVIQQIQFALFSTRKGNASS